MKRAQYSKQAVKKLAKMRLKDRAKLVKAVKTYCDGDFEMLDIKPLSGSNYQRIRVGDWRIILLDEIVVYVVKIGARGDVYKN